MVIEKTKNDKAKKKCTFWLCKCECGNTSIVSTTDLVSGKITQCWDCAHKASGKSKRKDLTGHRFGKLTVTKMLYSVKDKNGRIRTRCECKCDCGNIVIRNADKFKPDTLSSCGCARKEIGMRLRKNIIGQKFGRLTVVEDIPGTVPLKVRCKCDCGNEVILRKNDVMSSHTSSCGCLHSDRTRDTSTKDWQGYISDYGVKAICRHTQNTKQQWLWEFECPLCHNHFIALPAKIANGHTTSCGCRTQSSKEFLIENILKQLQVPYQTQYSFNDCKNKYVLRFDFALFKNNQPFYLIEYDGEQHYTQKDFFGGLVGLKATQDRDQIKNQYCIDNSIPLLRLRYDLTDTEIKEKILNIINP